MTTTRALLAFATVLSTIAACGGSEDSSIPAASSAAGAGGASAGSGGATAGAAGATAGAAGSTAGAAGSTAGAAGSTAGAAGSTAGTAGAAGATAGAAGSTAGAAGSTAGAAGAKSCDGPTISGPVGAVFPVGFAPDDTKVRWAGCDADAVGVTPMPGSLPTYSKQITASDGYFRVKALDHFDSMTAEIPGALLASLPAPPPIPLQLFKTVPGAVPGTASAAVSIGAANKGCPTKDGFTISAPDQPGAVIKYYDKKYAEVPGATATVGGPVLLTNLDPSKKFLKPEITGPCPKVSHTFSTGRLPLEADWVSILNVEVQN